MPLRSLELRPAYETLSGTDAVQEFYIPTLSESVEYDRSAGFFSSASLALAARGIAGLIHNGGRMRLVVSPHLSNADIEAIKRSTCDQNEAIELIMSHAMSDVELLADEIERDHVRALGWMLSNGFLELKVACIVDDEGNVCPEQLFHQKVGIMRDSDGDAVSFSGSINETASGWMANSEEFKVFKSWDEGQRIFFEADENKFDEVWHNKRSRVRTFSANGAFCDLLVSEGKHFDIEYSSIMRMNSRSTGSLISLFSYQKQAVKTWRDAGGKLLFEMATGTGKTRTALACVQELLVSSKRFVCVIATPQSTLSRQWERELVNLGLQFDITVFADSSAKPSRVWASDIRSAMGRIAIGRARNLLVLTTHKSASNPLLINAIEEADPSIALCLVGDEVHGMGAPEYQRALLERYEYRIGLSATPSRWFDDAGTTRIRNYFGGNTFEFTIKDAQETINPLTGKTFLCPYEYHLIPVELTDDEADKFDELTKRISKLSHSDDEASKERLDHLLRMRAQIKKDAEAKLDRLDTLLDEIQANELLVFTSPKRIDEVESILAKHRIAAHRFTQEQGTRPKKEYDNLSERDYLIKMFKAGALQALVAIKCLDEGIDIPQASDAILLSSSTNPREYVQRVGRVIRRYPGKDLARIFDFIVAPDWERLRLFGDIQSERKLFE